jgi:hypothetical protein
MPTKFPNITFLATWLLFATCWMAALRASNWADQFRNPPPQNGIGVYWWWFGPAVTAAEVDRELDVMHRAGIGSILIYPVYPVSVDDPQRGIKNLRYLSPEFLEVLGHAVTKASELGLRADLVIGTGWPFGGPKVRPELGARRLRIEMVEPRAGASGSLPVLKPGEKLEAALLIDGNKSSVNLDTAVDVTEQVSRGGSVPLPGGRLLMIFIDSPTGMRVKRPSLGAEGLVLDHLSAHALTWFLDDVAAKLVDTAGARNLGALHSDSLEVFNEEWTPGILSEFSRRRGYDLKHYLPALVADAGPRTGDVRYDFWRTVSELALDNYVRPLHEWCARHGVMLQSESYGTPPVDMSSYADTEYPMGESYDWKTFVASRWASSAAHQYGKRVISAEAYTWLRFPRYVSTLQDVKLGSDLHFVCGINRLVAHGYGYSPPAAGVPGWGYYASIMLNDNNPWWPYFRLLSDYVRRTSYVLSLGAPRVDVAVYLPEDDVMAKQPVGDGLNLYMSTKFRLSGDKPVQEFGLPSAYQAESAVLKTIMTAGYSFDGFDRSILQPGLKTSAGRLEVGDVSYRIVVLPDLRGISLPILEHLADFCRSGGVLIATRRLPDAAYGLKDHDANCARVQRVVAELFGSGPSAQTRRNAYGRGTAIYVPDDTDELGRVLALLDPEVRFERPDADVAFVHRGQGEHDIYFLANTSATSKMLKAIFRDGRAAPRFCDAMSGTISDAPLFRKTRDGIEVSVHLEPYGSILVVFDSTGDTAPIHATNVPAENLDFDTARRSWFARVSEPGRYFLETANGRVERSVTRPVTPIVLNGRWTLRIGDDDSNLDVLKSWTEVPGHSFYSGRGNYRKEVDLPAEAFGPDRGLWLDLGEVREIAEVSINGNPAGVCWKRPHRIDITKWAKAGRNAISIDITNLLINKILGAPTPDYAGLEPLRFQLPQEKTTIPVPLPSGLLGPVRVVPYTIIRAR